MERIIKNKVIINEKIKINSPKEMTKIKPLKILEDARVFYVSLNQHIGQPAKEMVEIGDFVKEYQKIGEIQGAMSSYIHSPISGKVINIIEDYLANGNLTKIIVIENDFKNEKIEVEKRTINDVLKLSKEEILENIKNNGIVGEGGAQFPTHVKYSIGEKKVEILILNGAECEPYLTSDYTLMLNYTNEFFDGIRIVDKLLEPKEIIIGIEEENEDLVNKFLPLIKEKKLDKVKIQILPNSYPQGSELQLIKTVTNKELKKGSLPINFGVVVSNVSTIKSIYDGLVENIPLVERIVTISGEKVKRVGNYIIKIGTPINHIIKKLIPDRDAKVIFGEPMMGHEVVINEKSKNTPTLKGTGGILFLSNEIDEVERKNCISCNACVDVCPMGLLPLYFAKYYKKGNMKKQIKLNIDSCLECGACEYACPSRVPLIQSIKESKKEISKLRSEGGLK